MGCHDEDIFSRLDFSNVSTGATQGGDTLTLIAMLAALHAYNPLLQCRGPGAAGAPSVHTQEYTNWVSGTVPSVQPVKLNPP